MIKFKNKEQIAILAEGGKILSRVINEVINQIKPGISTAELNNLAEDLIQGYGAIPSFKNYQPYWSKSSYPAALCISINNEVVHGIPSHDRILQSGDIISLDCGLKYKGLYTDMAVTIGVDKISPEAKKLLKVTKEALIAGIKKIKPGRKLSDVAKTINKVITLNGFSAVRQLCGHGVGLALHEDPQIPNYWPSLGIKDVVFEEGMVLALEPMVNMGDWPVKTLDDGWTVVTVDGSLSAHFEHTIAVTKEGHQILTK